MHEWGFGETVDYILFVAEKVADERLYSRWVLHYEDKFGFEEFKEALLAVARPKIEPTSVAIEADVAKICSMKVR